jgi:hypothetical protein
LAALSICPVCGISDCGNEQYLWAEFDNQKKAIKFGRDTFGSFLDRCYEDKLTEEEYQKLPEFIKEYNECRDWAAFVEPNVKIDAKDFISSS